MVFVSAHLLQTNIVFSLQAVTQLRFLIVLKASLLMILPLYTPAHFYLCFQNITLKRSTSSCNFFFGGGDFCTLEGLHCSWHFIHESQVMFAVYSSRNPIIYQQWLKVLFLTLTLTCLGRNSESQACQVNGVPLSYDPPIVLTLYGICKIWARKAGK